MKELSSCDLVCPAFVVSLEEGLFSRRSVTLSGAAVFGALAAVSTVVFPASVQPPFPLLTFLKFDPAELFSVLAFMVFGPVPALVTATVHWLFLTATGQDSPLGPAAKFAAVLSTLLGMWLGSVTYRHVLGKHRRASLAFGSMLGFSALSRVAVMLVVNYFVFTYLGPVIFGINYLGFSAQYLGLQSAGMWQVLMAMLVLTSIFNALHVLFSVGLPFIFVTPLSFKIPEIASSHPWISRFNKG